MTSDREPYSATRSAHSCQFESDRPCAACLRYPAHQPMKVSAAMGGRPGRWVCSCGQSATDAGWHQVWMVKASFREHVDA